MPGSTSRSCLSTRLNRATSRRPSDTAPAFPRPMWTGGSKKIGRASCRGRGEISVVAGSLKKKKKRDGGGRGSREPRKRGKVTRRRKEERSERNSGWAAAEGGFTSREANSGGNRTPGARSGRA